MRRLVPFLLSEASVAWHESPLDRGKFWRVHRARAVTLATITSTMLAFCIVVMAITVALPL